MIFFVAVWKLLKRFLRRSSKIYKDLMKIFQRPFKRSWKDFCMIPQRSCRDFILVLCKILYRSLYGSLKILLRFLKNKRRPTRIDNIRILPFPILWRRIRRCCDNRGPLFADNINMFHYVIKAGTRHLKYF